MNQKTFTDAEYNERKHKTKQDEEMHQTKKGNEWHFGMKVHSGCDTQTGYVHTVTATAANAHDITEAHKLIRDDDDVVSNFARFPSDLRGKSPAGSPSRRLLKVRKSSGRLTFPQEFPNFWFPMGTRGEYGL